MKKIILILIYSLTIIYAIEPTPKYISTKSWGVELNPLSILSLLVQDEEDSSKFFSGTLSYFDNENGVEIAIPIFYIQEEYWGNYRDHNTYNTNIGIDYRKFLHNKTKGLYYGGFAMYSYLDGKLKNDSRYARVDKLGIGAEVGFRLMNSDSEWSIYWGPSIRLGAYLTPHNNIFQEDTFGMEFYDKRFFVDIDFMKIGLRF